MEVHKNLGDGFLEKVYENAMMVTLKRVGIASMQQAPITVHFEGEAVGEYYADILVEEKIILEFKAVEGITGTHRAQALNYLKSTGLRVAIILNLGANGWNMND